ncbi:MAG: ATP-binding protein [Bacteroidales bacterium]
MIPRIVFNQVLEKLFKGKAIILMGARQVGKTTLLRMIESQAGYKSLWLDCDEIDVQEKLTNVTSAQLKNLIGTAEIVFIDEAQRVENIGITLKLITDNIKNVQLIVSGSSSFELSDKINEPLTGRKFEYKVFPISSAEMKLHTSLLEESRLLETRMIYGFYPEVINRKGEEQIILKEILNSYLYKDVLMFRNLRKPHILPKLLQAIALQIGSEVSYTELARLIEVDKETIERYIDILEKMFVVFRLGSLSRNLRTEINKSRKIYFYDLGLRNALISNFNPLSLRSDVGALWENFLIAERMKMISNLPEIRNLYFWRTQLQQEIDYIEEYDGNLYAYEFKWKEGKSAKLSKSFSQVYPNHSFKLVNPSDYWDFIGID